jgi:hypothetical protein
MIQGSGHVLAALMAFFGLRDWRRPPAANAQAARQIYWVGDGSGVGVSSGGGTMP